MLHLLPLCPSKRAGVIAATSCATAQFFGLMVIFLIAFQIEVHGQSPTAIGGRTIQLSITSGTAPFASSGVYRFLPSATDNSYALVPVSGLLTPSIGTHTYSKTGDTTAQLSFTDSVSGTVTAACTFSTTNSGTYFLTGVSFPGSSQTGTFLLYSGTAPVSMGGLNMTVTITSGAQPFATNGNYQFLPTLSGNTYSIVGRSGVADSSGSYSYIQNSPMTGIISFTDSKIGSGFSSQLSFDSETSGTIFLRQSVGGGYQTGTFMLVSPGTVVAWGNNTYGQTSVPVAAQSGVTAIAAGYFHTVALKAGGILLSWGRNDYGQTNVPIIAQSGVSAIVAGYSHTVALKTNGSVVAWGYNGLGQTNVPIAAQSGVAAIGAGNYHSLALKTNGMVVAWGENSNGQSTVPVTAQSGVVAIAAGWTHTVALKTNGAVVAWGGGTNNTGSFPHYGQSIVPSVAQSGVIAIAAGGLHTVALKTNGSVVAWGAGASNTGFTPNVGQSIVPIAAQSGVIAIAAGQYYTVALKTNGSIVAWGLNDFGQTNLPVTVQSGVGAIASRYSHTVALFGSGLVLPVSLSPKRSGNELILSWPTTAVGFKLQSALDVAPPVTWSDTTNVPVIIGSQFTVTNTTSGSGKFYRLKKP
jgi:alpha-tubulin suppressor-like RCC1 family protein